MIEINKLEKNIYKPGSPVIITNCGLYKDTMSSPVYIQMDIQNISDKVIASVIVDIHVFDIANNVTELIRDFVYDAKKSIRNDVFGTKPRIELTGVNAANLAVALKQVNFTDGSVYYGTPSILYRNMPAFRTVFEEFAMMKNVNSDEELSEDIYNEIADLSEQYNRDFIEKFADKKDVQTKYVPFEYSDLWLCSCGQINHSDEHNCYNCGAELLPQKIYIKKLDTIQENLTAHTNSVNEITQEEKELKEKHSMERAMAFAEAYRVKANAKLLADAKAKRQRFIRILCLAVVAPLTIGLLVYLFTLYLYIIPNNNYNQAVKDMENQKFDSAIEQFSNLNTFNGSDDMLLEAIYQKGEYLLAKQDYDNAIDSFNKVKSYKNSDKKITEATYQKSVNLYNQKEYALALEGFSKIKSYSNTSTYVNDCNLQLAKTYALNKDIKHSIDYFKLLTGAQSLEVQNIYLKNGIELYADGNFDEANLYFVNVIDTELAKQVHGFYYEKGVEYIGEKKYDEAYELFSTIPDYLDSKNKLVEIKYLIANDLFENSDFENAKLYYESIGNYENSAAQLTECKYQIALKSFTLNDMENARKLFEDLGDYEKSASYFEKASLSYGLKLFQDKEYLKSYEILYLIKDNEEAFNALTTYKEFYDNVYDVGKGVNPLYE